MGKGLSLEEFGKMHGFDREESFSSQKKSQQKNFSSQKNFQQKSFGGNNQSNKNNAENFLATATYNFVSLPEKILPSPVETVEDYKKQMQSMELFSGEIELNIENLTPLFIGGNGEKTFSPVAEIIPGSTLRGMFKNIFKIVTCGAFRGKTSAQKKGEDFNDEHIYFRCLMTSKNSPAWTKELHDLYNNRMTSQRQGKLVKNARPGFLIQTTDGKFFIAPSIYRTDKKDDRILIKDYEKKFNDKVEIRNNSQVTWHGREAYIITGSQKNLYDAKSYETLQDKKRAGKQFIRFTKIDYVDWSKDHWLELPDEVRESYEHDRNRKGVNLFKCGGILNRKKILELAKNVPAEIKTLVPCHFLEEKGQVTAFGHGQCFRIPYKNSIGDAVEKNLQTDIVDFSDAIFGKPDCWASRVFFEDAKIISDAQILETADAHALMQPNPTSYQLYLQQNNKNSLNHWDSPNAKIRGYKLYWHNKNYDWQASKFEIEEDKKKSADKKIIKKFSPFAEKNKFKSKIRFENLTKIELGALLMIFDLNGAKNPAYKIGMGKPLGLGSIKISPKLFIESETAYTELFDGDFFKNPYREENFSEYLDAFKNFVEERGFKNIWQKVMDELNIILDWSNTQKNNWQEKIKSMSGNVQSGEVDNRFKNRVPLPTIFQVVK